MSRGISGDYMVRWAKQQRISADRTRVAPLPSPDYEQCSCCGAPATCWPVYELEKLGDGELPLRERYVEPMCDTCHIECEELRAAKKRQGYR